MDLVVEVDARDGWAVVHVHGDVDMTTAPRLREQAIQVMADGQPKVVLDLEGVDFIDSTGLGVLVGLLKRARSLGGDLLLVSTRESLHTALELTSLERALPPAVSVEAALGLDRRAGG